MKEYIVTISYSCFVKAEDEDHAELLAFEMMEDIEPKIVVEEE